MYFCYLCLLKFLCTILILYFKKFTHPHKVMNDYAILLIEILVFLCLVRLLFYHVPYLCRYVILNCFDF